MSSTRKYVELERDSHPRWALARSTWNETCAWFPCFFKSLAGSTRPKCCFWAFESFEVNAIAHVNSLPPRGLIVYWWAWPHRVWVRREKRASCNSFCSFALFRLLRMFSFNRGDSSAGFIFPQNWKLTLLFFLSETHVGSQDVWLVLATLFNSCWLDFSCWADTIAYLDFLIVVVLHEFHIFCIMKTESLDNSTCL